VCVRGRVAVLHAHLLSERRKQATSGRIHARQRARDESLVRRSSRPPRPDNSRPLRWSFPPPLPPWPTERDPHISAVARWALSGAAAHPMPIHLSPGLVSTSARRCPPRCAVAVTRRSASSAHRRGKVRRATSCQSRGLSPCRPPLAVATRAYCLHPSRLRKTVADARSQFSFLQLAPSQPFELGHTFLSAISNASEDDRSLLIPHLDPRLLPKGHRHLSTSKSS
jgi:hypothetical protein